MTSNEEVCPVCGVTKKILPTDVAIFETSWSRNSSSPPLTGAQTRARICQFAVKAGCINEYTDVHPSQGYLSPPSFPKLEN